MSMSRTIAVVAITAATATASTVAVAAVAPHSTSPRTVASSTYSSHAVPSRLTSRVIGSFGSAGKVSGTFVPLRSFVRAGHTVVQGNMTARLVRGSGAVVGTVSRHNVTIPVDAPGARATRTAAAAPRAAASCSILNLVLGPLDLNLLGLAVHLNRVVLTITALPGAGALLGNLLCAVANLLNGPFPTLTSLLNLSSLLNRILGLIT